MLARFKVAIHPVKNGISEFICTSVDDIAKLPKRDIEGTQVLNDGNDTFNNTPCDYFSRALVKGNGVYVLFPDNEWAQI